MYAFSPGSESIVGGHWVQPGYDIFLIDRLEVFTIAAASVGGGSVPEPSSLAIFGAAALMTTGWQWRRRSASAKQKAKAS